MSYITNYLKITENTQPAYEFHIWSMLASLSTFAGRRFWFPFGPLNFYPNLYVTLVGPPGDGKSTAMNVAKNLVRASQQPTPICAVAASQITKEALTLEMAHEKFVGKRQFARDGRLEEYNAYAIFATEFVDFIAVNPQGFLDFLTAVWDEPVYEVKTKNKGHDYVVGPYITLLGCMTPEKMRGFMKLSILTGGFARRTVFVYPGYKNIVHWPTRTEEQIAAERACVAFGRALQNESGPFSVTEECKSFYEEWNTQNEKTMTDKHPSVRGWYQSKGEMLWKISMLVALAEDPKERTIDIGHYKLALKFCHMSEKTLERVFEGTGINPHAETAAQICRMLEGLDRPMSMKKLEALFFGQARSITELKDTIGHLIQVGRLASRDIIANGMHLGTAIATPECLARYSDVQLAVFLQRSSAPPSETGVDSGPSTGPSTTPPDPRQGRSEGEVQDPTEP